MTVTKTSGKSEEQALDDEIKNFGRIFDVLISKMEQIENFLKQEAKNRDKMVASVQKELEAAKAREIQTVKELK